MDNEDLSGLPEYSDRWKTMSGAEFKPINQCYKIGIVGDFNYDSEKDPLDLKNRLYEIINAIDEYPKCIAINPAQTGVPAIAHALAKYAIRMRIAGFAPKVDCLQKVDNEFYSGEDWCDEIPALTEFVDIMILVGNDQHTNKVRSYMKLVHPNKEIINVD